MTELPKDKVSSAQGPFKLHAWMELPFPLAVEINQVFKLDYCEGNTVEAQLTLRSNIYKVVTGNRWQESQEFKEYVARIRAGAEASFFSRDWILKYVPVEELSTVVAELESSDDIQYVHVEKVPAVVYLSVDVPDSVVPEDDFVPYDLSPRGEFFSEKVLPYLHSLVDAYRIAAYPEMRYSIAPVSEAIVDEVVMNFTDKDGNWLGRIHYGFDVHSPWYIVSKIADLQARFDSILPRIDALQAETQMAISYYLYRMRRWAEAVAVASSVVEGLQRDLVSRLASSDIEAEAILKAFRYKQRFNKVFPAFKIPKLSETNKKLWDAFVDAMEYRGAKVHGNHPEPFGQAQREIVQKHLQAFHNVASWLCKQMERSWKLDVTDGGKSLAAFP